MKTLLQLLLEMKVRTQEMNSTLIFTQNIYCQRYLSFGIAGSSSLLSDNRSLGINESAVNYAALFSEVRPARKNTHQSVWRILKQQANWYSG